jgi:signal transduction histidine kinase
MLRASFRIKASSNEASGGVVVVLRDITAEREAQRAKDSFVASISQELRTPMTSIVGYADLLLGESVGPLAETQDKFLRRIRANAGQIGNLLNDLVGMMTIDSKQLEIKAEALNLLDAIQEASKSIDSQLAEKAQVLETNLDPHLPYVQADPDAIYHMLTSLLRNAHHCSPENAHIVLRATRMSKEEAAYVLISITDAGGGIAPESYRRVFNRFYRSDDPSVPGLGDPGVGLPIVKVLVEAHGGRVWIDTQTGVGSTFTILLPVHPATIETHGRQAVS